MKAFNILLKLICKKLRQNYTDEDLNFILMKAHRFFRYFLLLNTDEPTLSGCTPAFL